MPTTFVQNPTEAGAGTIVGQDVKTGGNLTAGNLGFSSLADFTRNYNKDAGAGNTYAPTVVTDANIRENTIPNMVSSASKYTQPSPVADTGTAGANNTNVATTGGEKTPTDYSNMSYADMYKSILSGLNGQPLDPTVQAELDLINGMKSNSDAVTQASVQAIQQQFQSRYANTIAQQKASTAGVEQALNLSGSSRYAPVSSSGILSSKEKYDIQTLNDLQASENSQIAQLRQAQVEQNYKAMSDTLAVLDKTRQEKIALARDIAQNMAATNKDTRDKLQAAQSDAAKTALANGAPASVITAIQNAKNPTEAYAAASGYGGGANISIEKITNPDQSTSFVMIDKNTRKIVGSADYGGGAPAGSGTSLTPTDYKDFITGLTPEGASNFNKLSPEDQSNVKQLLSGDALLSDLFTSRGAAGATLRQQVLQKAQAVDPTFSENVNKQRYKFMTEWNNPNAVAGKTRNSINTALGHLADVKELTKELKPWDIQWINNTSNWWDAKTGSPEIVNLQFGLMQLATEIATVYKGAAPSDEEIKAEKAVLGTQLSKAQFDGVLNTAAKFLSSKITAARYQYKNVMGKELNTSIIDPDKKQALIDAGIDTKVFPRENIPGQPKTGVAAYVDTAQSQGYAPKDILTNLQTKQPEYTDKINAALDKGWTVQEILDYLSNQ